MTAHAALEQLSALIDGELAAPKRRAVEEHLAACFACRRKLDGLRAVAGSLAGVGQAAAPRALDLWAAQIRSSAGAEVSHLRRPLRGGTSSQPAGPPLVLSMALVVGLATLVYAFALTVTRAGSSTASRHFVVLQGVADLGPGATRAGERLFRRERGGWVEAENGEIPGPVRAATARERAAVLRELPELRPLLARADVELVWRGERLRLARGG